MFQKMSSLLSLIGFLIFLIFQESQGISDVMGIELPNDSTFIEDHLRLILNKVSILWL